jgi:hypothetical protein
VNIKIAGKWMFIPLKMVLIGIDPYPPNVFNPSKRKGARNKNVKCGRFFRCQPVYLSSRLTKILFK